jgi:hypothetical protein
MRGSVLYFILWLGSQVEILSVTSGSVVVQLAIYPPGNVTAWTREQWVAIGERFLPQGVNSTVTPIEFVGVAGEGAEAYIAQVRLGERGEGETGDCM